MRVALDKTQSGPCDCRVDATRSIQSVNVMNFVRALRADGRTDGLTASSALTCVPGITVTWIWTSVYLQSDREIVTSVIV
jgi:hypothetical protein